jgi:DNA-binding PadR family transcriptional regulator
MYRSGTILGPWFRGRFGPMAMGGRGRRGPGSWEFGGGPRLPFGGFPFGKFRPPMGWRGPRVGRGDVRAAILVLLSEKPLNGYQIMQELGQRSRGLWRPSPGSVYPALQQLEDEGLVLADESEGRRTFHLTDAGRAYVEEHKDEVSAPWEAVSDSVDEGLIELRDLIFQVGGAVMQVAHAGTDAQVARARQVLTDTRRTLYRILADEDTEGEPTP